MRNAVDLADFKREKDVRLVPAAPVGAQPKVIPSDVIPSFAYGRKSRPSTPINAVVGYQYAAEYEEAIANDYGRYQASRSLIATSMTKRDSFDLSRTPPELFKLSKFKKVPCRFQLAPLSNSGSMERSQSMPLLA